MHRQKSWSDQRFIDALSLGGQPKEDAVAQAIKQFIHYLPTVAKKTGLTKEEALDPYTDAIVKLSDQVTEGQYRGESSLGTYFYRIFYFKSVDLFRKKTTNRVDYNESLPAAADTGPLANERIEQSEEMAQLNKKMDKLGNPCKKILLDWGFWGYSMTEIAERNGLQSSSQAKDKKYKCLKALRVLLA
ncbi:MAG: RNA polymerase sigma factor [Saprospiraceae bacterium]